MSNEEYKKQIQKMLNEIDLKSTHNRRERPV